MPKSLFPNYLRTIRKRSGLSQDEVAFLLGSPSGGIVSRYERFNRLPSIETACAYEALFGNPVRELFAGVFQKASEKIAKRAQLLARKLEGRAPDGAMARKLQILRSIGNPQGMSPAAQS